MPLLFRRIRARYPAWRRTCHNRSRRQKNRAWHARRGFGPSRSEPGLTSEQQEAAKTEILNRRSRRSQRVVGVLTSRFGSRQEDRAQRVAVAFGCRGGPGGTSNRRPQRQKF